MKNNQFVIEQKALLSLLSAMQPICSKRTTLDVTETILFHLTPRELTLKSTDLEISLQSISPLENSAVEGVSFLVSGKRIFELVKELDGEIEFTVTDAQLKLKAGGVALALNIRNAEDFPPFPERIENLMQLKADFLLTLLNKVAFLIPQNNSNPALNGLQLEFNKEGMTLVTTDGHCLAKVHTSESSYKEDKKWLLPKRAVVEIKKILETSDTKSIFLGVCGSQLVFSGDNFNFFTKLLSDPFPEYEQVLKKDGFVAASMLKADILKALKRANCLLAGQFISTQFTFKPEKLDVSLRNKEVGALEESLPLVAFSGQKRESRFYSPYLLNGLSVFSEKDLKFYIKNTSTPIIFESVQDQYHFTYLVMPVSAGQTS